MTDAADPFGRPAYIDMTTLDAEGQMVWANTTDRETITIAHGDDGQFGKMTLGPGGAYGLWTALRDFCTQHYPDLVPPKDV